MTVIKPEQRNSVCTTDDGTKIKSCYLVAHGPLNSQKNVRQIHISTLSRELGKLEDHSDPSFPLLEMVTFARYWKVTYLIFNS